MTPRPPSTRRARRSIGFAAPAGRRPTSSTARAAARGAPAAEHAARALLDRIRSPGGAAPDVVDVAVGVAGFPEHGTTPGALIARALAALDSVRGRGPDKVGVPPAESAPLLGDIIVADSQMARVYELVR